MSRVTVARARTVRENRAFAAGLLVGALIVGTVCAFFLALTDVASVVS